MLTRVCSFTERNEFFDELAINKKQSDLQKHFFLVKLSFQTPAEKQIHSMTGHERNDEVCSPTIGIMNLFSFP